MQKWLLFSLLLLLSGCSLTPEFNPPEFNKVVIVDIEINDNLGKDKRGRRIMGTAQRKFGICYLKLPTIRWLYDQHSICTWGHELMHCVLGTFHTEDDEGTCW